MDKINCENFFSFVDSDQQVEKVRKANRCKLKRSRTINDHINLSNETQFIENPIYYPAEKEEGNIEHKLKISNPTDKRFEHLLTQMYWRIKNGNGEALYRLGFHDNGLVIGLNSKHANLSLMTIRRLAAEINCSVTILKEIPVKERGKIRLAYELSIKQIDKIFRPELRIAVFGSTFCGKSTLISVLTQSCFDDGNSKARSALGFRHLHELKSGHTSSISREGIYGYTQRNNVINYYGEISLKKFRNTADYQDEISSEDEDEFKIKTDEDILNSKILISLLDLPGSEKHLKTSIYGLVGHASNFSFLVLNTSDLKSNTNEHLNILLSLNLPFLIVLNKIDLGDDEKIMNFIEKNLSNQLGESKKLTLINDEKDIESYFCQLIQSTSISSSISNTINNTSNLNSLLNNVAIIRCSCVTGQSISLIYHFVNRLISNVPNVFNSNLFNSINNIKTAIEPFEFLIQDVFYQNTNDQNCTVIVGGLLSNGQLNRNDEILIGPFVGQNEDKSVFVYSKIKSIQRYKVTMNSLRQSESGSLELELSKENLNDIFSNETQLNNLLSNKSNESDKILLNDVTIKDKIRKNLIRKGMIIISKNTNLSTIKIGRDFKVKLNVISLNSKLNSIRKGYQVKIYMDNIKQSVSINQIENLDPNCDDEITNEITNEGTYLVNLKFIKYPEIIRIGAKFFLIERAFKATGSIIDIC